MALLAVAPTAMSQPITGAALSHRSSGAGGSDWTLSENGYVGTYFTLDNEGPVTLTVEASGSTNDAVSPHMNIVVADTQASFNVSSGFTNYEHTFDLPAGTYFVRTEFNNDAPTAERQLTIRDLSISGATTVNTGNTTANNANALAAADTYIANFRKGPANVRLPGVAPGTQVDVKLKRHAFNFGVGIPNSFTDTFLVPPGSPGADPNAAQFQQALVDNRINSLTPGNAGKWDATEGTRDVITTKQPPAFAAPYVYMDRIAQYAEEHNMGYRAHNLIWGQNTSGANNQQPNWVHNMLQNPAAIDTYNAISNPQGTNLTDIDALFSDLVAPAGTPNAGEKSEIHERIEYYVQDRAQQFYEIDVFNESYHTGSNNPGSSSTYWDHYGASGVAKIYKLAKEAIAAGGGNALALVNEYSVVQQQGGDYYANWYMRHIESIQNAGKALYGEDENVVGGIGFQYYASTNLASHVAARIHADMHNLAVQGLPISLTEFGVGINDNDLGNATKEANAAIVLNETTRLMFGMPSVTGMTLWELRTSGAFAPIGALYDTSNPTWAVRDTGIAWQQLQSEWDTQLMGLVVGPDSTIDFTGFYGDYEITIGGETFNLSLLKGTQDYSLAVTPGDYNADGVVDAADYVVWRKYIGQSATLTNRDPANSGPISMDDFASWRKNFGNAAPGGSGSAGESVPEPAMWVLLLAAMLGYSSAHARAGRYSGVAVAARSL